MADRDLYTNYETPSGYSDDGASCRREARRVAQSSTVWVYVIIFILLFLIFVFVILIYGKVKGFAVKPTLMSSQKSLNKPGRIFTGRVGIRAPESDDSDE